MTSHRAPQNRGAQPAPFAAPAVRQPLAQDVHRTSAVPAAAPRRPAMTPAGSFWYVLQCIAFGMGYFAKVPAKKALADAGMAEMTGAEKFWYVVQCIGFGAGYFAKLPVAKALTELR